MVILIEVASLNEGERLLQRWPEGEYSCYRGGQFNGGGMVVIEVASISYL